jgi:hypothetical protein
MALETRRHTLAAQPNVFTAELEHAICLLRDTRARLSLFVIEDADRSDAGAATLAEGLGQLGLAGMLGGGVAALLHMAPRLPGFVGDTNVERLVLDRLRAIFGGGAGAGRGRAPRVGVAHFQADRIATITELIDEAAAAPATRARERTMPLLRAEGA